MFRAHLSLRTGSEVGRSHDTAHNIVQRYLNYHQNILKSSKMTRYSRWRS